MNTYIRNAMCALTVTSLLFIISFSFTTPARAEATAAQLEKMQSLMTMIKQLQEQLMQLKKSVSNDSSAKCTELSRPLFLGSSDRDSDGEVSKLQRFLTSTGHYTYGEVTGYYGPATQRAVQAWQSKKGVVNSGSPETTGYGIVGPSTRRMMSRECSSTTPAIVPKEKKDDLPRKDNTDKKEIEKTKPTEIKPSDKPEDKTTSPTAINIGIVEGQVTYGPVCPVENVDNPCVVPEEVYTSRRVVIYGPTEMNRIDSQSLSSTGHFRLVLKPGNYWLQIEPAGIKSGLKKPVTVLAGQTQIVNFDIDSGIR